MFYGNSFSGGCKQTDVDDSESLATMLDEGKEDDSVGSIWC